MRHSILTFALLPVGTLALACQPNPVTSHSPHGLEKNVAYENVHVQCPDPSTRDLYGHCYDTNTQNQCASESGPDRKMCGQLWMSLCARRAGCSVTES